MGRLGRRANRQRLRNLVPESAITDDTRLVLVNAISFLGDWAQPFERSSTAEEDFRRPSGKTKVAMMHRLGPMRSAAVSGAKLVELDYRGESASMVFIVPEAVDGLASLERAFAAGKLDGWLKGLSEHEVALSLPKFTIDPKAALPLGDVLAGLGMPLAFDGDRADFTGIATPADPRKRLVLDEVFHQAFVRVDEKGTEAAAATAAMMGITGMQPAAPLEIRADRPFLWSLRDRATGLILFMGRVTEPRSEP